MATFHLKVLTAERLFFEGDVERCVVRVASGDMGILPRHTPCVAPLGIGALRITNGTDRRLAAISGGFVQVGPEQTTIIARTCEWADEIDLARAQQAKEHADRLLQQQDSKHAHDVAQVKLKKAINRIRVAQK